MNPHRGDTASAETPGYEVAVRGTQLDTRSPLSAIERLPKPRFVWDGGSHTVVGGGVAESIVAAGSNRFDTVRDGGESIFSRLDQPSAVPDGAQPRLFGGFGFHPTGPTETEPTGWDGFPPALFWLPAVQLTDTDDGGFLTVAASGGDADAAAQNHLEEWQSRLSELQSPTSTEPPGIESTHPTPDRHTWARQVREALDRIESGRLRKVVLAQALRVTLAGPLSIPSVLHRLAETDAECRRFLIQPEDGNTFFGATPEVLVTRNGRQVQTAALAGSTGRGDTPTEDEWLAESLRDSDKETHEHELVVEAICEQLDPHAGSVHAGTRRIRQLSTVQHLETPIRATLDSDVHVLSLVEALHPTPAVGGLPPNLAIETIREIETFERGWYAAPIGWFDGAGNGRFVVAIRSALASEGNVRLFAGDGIVPESDPDREWDELQLKYRPILDQLE